MVRSSIKLELLFLTVDKKNITILSMTIMLLFFILILLKPLQVHLPACVQLLREAAQCYTNKNATLDTIDNQGTFQGDPPIVLGEYYEHLTSPS